VAIEVRGPGGPWRLIKLPESAWLGEPRGGIYADVVRDTNWDIRDYKLYEKLGWHFGGPEAEDREYPEDMTDKARALVNAATDHWDANRKAYGVPWLESWPVNHMTLAQLQAIDWGDEPTEVERLFRDRFMPALARLGSPDDVRLLISWFG
jgi:hypothetical protein